MSCSLQQIIQVKDIKQIKSLLVDLYKEEEKTVDQGFGDKFKYEDGWEQDWGDFETTTSPSSSTSWLESCCISLSPTTQILAVVKDNTCIVLTKKWDINKKSKDAFFEVTWSGSLLPPDSQEKVSCILCVPLASQQRSSEGNPDWTCIIAGFTSGYIRIYMTNGSELMSQFLHNAPVLSIKLKTKNQDNEQIDELIVLYQQTIVTIDGFSIYQSLRACRNKLAKAKANWGSEAVDAPPLAYHKWKMSAKVTDLASCGTASLCLFDRLQSASDAGFHETVRGSAPAFTHFITTGDNHFLTVYHALQGSSSPIISEVAIAVANKLTSAVLSKFSAARGWWGGDEGNKPLQPKVEPGVPLSSRFYLSDRHRTSKNIVIAPVGRLAIVTDVFNRILLFDTSIGVVIRMWKGYRDAECGWMLVQEEDGVKRSALFLVIYAPKRGILEIYPTEYGSRVGAFNVGKECKLIYNGYQCLGETGGRRKETDMCYLLHPDGQIKSIHVPFHCALSSTHSIRAKDAHLLKKLSSVIEKISQDHLDICFKSIVEVFSEIQVPSSQKNAIDCILKSSLTVDSLRKCFTDIICCIKKKGTECADIEYEIECEKLVTYCQTNSHLLHTFLSLTSIEVEDVHTEVTVERIQEILQLSSCEESQRFVDTIINCKQQSKCAQKCNNLSAFLQCFDFEAKHVVVGQSPSSSTTVHVRLKDKLSQEHLIQLGALLFQDAIVGKVSVEKLTFLLESSKIHPQQLITVLASFTQSDCVQFGLKEVELVHRLVSSISTLKGGAEASIATLSVGSVCSWWQGVRDILCTSTSMGCSVALAYICRSITIQLTTVAMKLKEGEEIVEGGWEAVTMESEHWNLLVEQLHHLAQLHQFVHCNHLEIHLSHEKCSGRQFHIEPTYPPKPSKTSDRNPHFSVNGFTEGGFGSFAQAVASCLVRQGVPGPCLGVPAVQTPRSVVKNEEEEEDLPEEVEDSSDTQLLQSLVELRGLFPVSLQQDVLWSYCAWEAVMLWNEDVEYVDMLTTALVHLGCIHNARVKQGLAVMMWKVVYKETLQSLLELVEKIGKAPKDRLCKKTVGLSFKSLEALLLTGLRLLNSIIELDDADVDVPAFQPELIWRTESKSRSIIEQAADVPLCNADLLEHFWCLTTTLYLTMSGNLKGVKPKAFFDTKGRHAFSLPLHACAQLSTQFDEKILQLRLQFCCKYVRATISNLVTDDQANTSALHAGIELALRLGKRFSVDTDKLQSVVSCSLYAAGLDSTAKEMAMCIKDKDNFANSMLDVVGARLARCLLHNDAGRDAHEVYSKLPTTIYTWLNNILQQEEETSSAQTTVPLSQTFELLQYLHSCSTQHNSKHFKFIAQLIDSIAVFL